MWNRPDNYTKMLHRLGLGRRGTPQIKMKMASRLAFLVWFCNFPRSQLSDQRNAQILEAFCVLYKLAVLPGSSGTSSIIKYELCRLNILADDKPSEFKILYSLIQWRNQRVKRLKQWVCYYQRNFPQTHKEYSFHSGKVRCLTSLQSLCSYFYSKISEVLWDDSQQL